MGPVDAMPQPEGEAPRSRLSTAILCGLGAAAVTLALDLVSRFILGDQSLFVIANITAIVGALCLIGAAALLRKDDSSGPAETVRLWPLFASAALLVISVALRAAYFDENIGTPLRALVAGALAVGLAAWAALPALAGRHEPST